MFSIENTFLTALNDGHFLLACILAILAGFLTSLSPCVYPLIPITLSVMGIRRYDSPWHGFSIALVYVLGMSLLYAMLGIVFVSLGWLVGSSLQSPSITFLIACLFILMSLSMLGAFEFVVPVFILNRISISKGKGYKEAFLIGLFSGIIAAPCTGPVLTFILTLIGKEQDYGKGTLLMILYSLGVGLPFLVLGTFSSYVSTLPKSGSWMNITKNIFGIIMLTTGVYYLRYAWKWLYDGIVFLSHLGLPMLLILLFAGLVTGALQFSFKNKINLKYFSQGLSVLLVVFSLNGLAEKNFSASQKKISTKNRGENAWKTIATEKNAKVSFQKLLADAKAKKIPVVLDFYADWCLACKELDKDTYANDNIKKELSRFVTIKLDVTKDTPDLLEIQKQFEVIGLPTIVFIDSNGEVISKNRQFGFIAANKFLLLLKGVK